jgi:hypothetical protein
MRYGLLFKYSMVHVKYINELNKFDICLKKRYIAVDSRPSFDIIPKKTIAIRVSH